MTNKPKHKIWHEFNFYFAVGSFVGVFFTQDITLQIILVISTLANLGAAQGLSNKHNIEDLYREKNDD